MLYNLIKDRSHLGLVQIAFLQNCSQPIKMKERKYGTEKEHMRNQHMAKKRVNDWRVENLAGCRLQGPAGSREVGLLFLECGGLFKAVREAS